MKKTFIRVIAFVCILSLLSAFMVACKSDKTDETDDVDIANTNASNNEDDEEEYVYEQDVPKKDYNGAKIRILCSTQMQQFMVNDVAPVQVVRQAVRTRNILTEDLYNVKLEYVPIDGNGGNSDQFAAEIRNSVLSDTQNYDLVIPQSYYGTALATEGLYYNFADSAYIKWDKPWYYQKINEQCEIYGQTYFLASAYLMDKLILSDVVFYNAEMGKNHGISENELYSKVLEGKWTIDTMLEYMKCVDGDEYFGCVTFQHGIRALMIGSDTPFVMKDNTGELKMSYYSPHLIDVFQKVYDFAHGNEQRVKFSSEDEGILREFENGNSLFSITHMMSVPEAVTYGESDVDYIILPMPKFSEEQVNYITDVQRWELVSIPTNADVERACLVLDALSYYTYDELVPVMFEDLLGARWARDPNAAEIIEIIRQSIHYDFTSIFQSQMSKIYTGENSLVYLINNKDSGISEWWGSKGSMFGDYLDALILDYYELSLQQ